jgi:hypothetical protein
LAEPRADANTQRLVDVVEAKANVISPRDFLMIADTLCLSFRADKPHELYRLEAYTNLERWAPRHVVPPTGTAAQAVLQPMEFGSDRIDLGVSPTYEFDPRSEILRIQLERDPSGEDYQVSDCLFLRVEAGRLTSLLLKSLRIE